MLLVQRAREAPLSAGLAEDMKALSPQESAPFGGGLADFKSRKRTRFPGSEIKESSDDSAASNAEKLTSVLW